ncbi:putative N-acetyltransferase 8B isoform 1-T3 [Leptodactylus fuscus]|uniref:N-acetyltransferase 8B-like n=1 Tax=Leptodactylus fuscus TaxID=238119 RepID=UPI003F4F069D
MSDYSIRLYKDSDYQVARDLFAEGLVEHTNIAFKHALRQPQICLPVMAVLTLPALNLVSITMAVLLVTVAVVALWFCSRYMYTSYINYCLSDDMLDIRKYYLQRDGYCFWVAESTGGEVMGTVAALPSTQPGGEKHLELKRLSVAPEHRGKGIAKVLCRTLIDFGRKRGCEAVVLSTTVPQINATRLYEKLGFRQTQTFPHLGLLGKFLDFRFLVYQYDIPAA